MSKWYEAEEGDIDIDHENKEVDIFVCADDWGSIYLTVSFDQIKEIASKTEEPKP